MFYSHLGIQHGRGQAQGQSCSALGSLSSEMWDLALGEMLLSPRGLPTPQRAGSAGITTAHAERVRPRALHSRCYFPGVWQQLAPVPGPRTQQRRGSYLLEQLSSSTTACSFCLMAASVPRTAERTGATRAPLGHSRAKRW